MTLPGHFIAIPCTFLVIAVLIAGLTRLLEDWEEHRRRQRVLKKKEFIREDGSVDRIQYLRDLYNIIKHYIDEMKGSDGFPGEDQDANKKSQERKLRELEEIQRRLQELYEQLRFSDGRSLEDNLPPEQKPLLDESSMDEEEEEEEEEEEAEEKEIDQEESFDPDKESVSEHKQEEEEAESIGTSK